MSVRVLEARQRVGGRVHTLFDQPGLPEMGFNAMGAGYGRALDAAKRAGVDLYDVAPRFAGFRQELVLGRQVLSRDAWAKSPANPFPADARRLIAWEIAGKLMHEHNPLGDWSQWQSPGSAALDISLHDFLASQGLSDAAIHLAVDTSPYYGTTAYDISALMYEFSDGWVKTQIGAGPQSWVVKGGNERLPMAMARLLKGDLLLGKEAIGVSSDETGGDGGLRRRLQPPRQGGDLRPALLDPAAAEDRPGAHGAAGAGGGDAALPAAVHGLPAGEVAFLRSRVQAGAKWSQQSLVAKVD